MIKHMLCAALFLAVFSLDAEAQTLTVFGSGIVVDTPPLNPIDTFVFMGQSNCEGAPSGYSANTGDQQNVYFLVHDSDTSQYRSINALAPQSSTLWGSELSFATNYTAGTGVCCIIKVCDGGLSLANDFDPEGGQWWSNSISAFAAASSLLKAKGYCLNSKTVIWIQGEEDSKLEATSLAYSTNLTNFIEAWRDVAGDSQWITCRMHDSLPSVTFPYPDSVRAAQTNQSLANYSWIDCDGLSLKVDSIHYDISGLTLLGNLIVEEVGANE